MTNNRRIVKTVRNKEFHCPRCKGYANQSVYLWTDNTYSLLEYCSEYNCCGWERQLDSLTKEQMEFFSS